MKMDSACSVVISGLLVSSNLNMLWRFSPWNFRVSNWHEVWRNLVCFVPRAHGRLGPCVGCGLRTTFHRTMFQFWLRGKGYIATKQLETFICLWSFHQLWPLIWETARGLSLSKGCHLDVVRGPSTPHDLESDAGGSLISWQPHPSR
jgi:hypothetical protein